MKAGWAGARGGGRVRERESERESESRSDHDVHAATKCRCNPPRPRRGARQARCFSGLAGHEVMGHCVVPIYVSTQSRTRHWSVPPTPCMASRSLCCSQAAAAAPRLWSQMYCFSACTACLQRYSDPCRLCLMEYGTSPCGLASTSVL